MNPALDHLVVAPVVLPLAAGALCALTGARWARMTTLVSVAATLAFLIMAALLVRQAHAGTVQVYLLGNWPAPFGIALVLDRLAALMLLLTALVALVSGLYALGGEARRGRHFHALFHFQLMGLAGAFLTADLFNLFVFFEVLLAASYGLMLHGGDDRRRERLKATLHYVVFNLTGSALFLLAVSLLYGLTGTLNMADLALRLHALPADSGTLAQAAALMLLVVFAVKAALLPLYFWLPDAYASASAPVAALFAIMTKVGVYAIARTTTLMFGAGPGFDDGTAGATSLVFQPMLPALALATLVLAAIGVLAARRLRGLIAYLVVGSAGTLLLAIGLATRETVAAGLFYLVPSTLVAAVWFLIADRIAAARDGSDALLDRRAVTGAAWAPLGVAFFIAAVAAAGMPPLAAFFGKAKLLAAAGVTPWAPWAVALILGSSLALIVALARAGGGLFWWPTRHGNAAPTVVPADRPAPRSETAHLPTQAIRATHPTQRGAIAVGLALVIACTVFARPLSIYTHAAALQLFARGGYIAAVLGADVVPPAYDVRREMRERGELK
jgi:multicomponent K+:H+ antiporter subunit D